MEEKDITQDELNTAFFRNIEMLKDAIIQLQENDIQIMKNVNKQSEQMDKILSINDKIIEKVGNGFLSKLGF